MINIKLDDSQISINDDCRSKKSILERLSLLLNLSAIETLPYLMYVMRYLKGSQNF